MIFEEEFSRGFPFESAMFQIVVVSIPRRKFFLQVRWGSLVNMKPLFRQTPFELQGAQIGYFTKGYNPFCDLDGCVFRVVFGHVEWGSSPTSPFRWLEAIQRSRDRLLYRHALIASTSLISFRTVGTTQRICSSLIVFAIDIAILPF